MMNVFQGGFPAHDTGADGWIGTAPVDAYPPNGFGLCNTTGNVWERCADWYSPKYSGTALARTRPARRRAPPGSCAAGHTSATSPTAGATE